MYKYSNKKEKKTQMNKPVCDINVEWDEHVYYTIQYIIELCIIHS